MKFKFFKRKREAEQPVQRGLFSTHVLGEKVQLPFMLPDFQQPAAAPTVTSDSGYIGEPASPKRGMWPVVNEAQLMFYASASHFIGYQACAMLAANWLVDKTCSMPARDAIRQGYTLGDTEEQLRNTDKRFGVMRHLRELVHFGRVYGGRLILFDVASENPEAYYKAPFNLDGVERGAYRGMSQIDPNWVTPVLTEDNVRDPASRTYYEPTYWRVGERIIHRSHLHIFVPYPVPDFLKPSYNYLGMPVPQRIMERVYAAERSANEGPQLLMTKRTTTLQVSDAALVNRDALEKNIRAWTALRDNYGVKVNGPEENMQQYDTALADVDTVIMTQYQLVAAAANVPATKLFGTQPKGFNATGEYEAESYREELESVQTNDLTPLLVRHYELVAKSEGILLTEPVNVQWMPIDSPTAKEWAEIEKLQAERDKVLWDTGAIDAEDIRDRLRDDRESDYHGIQKGSLNGEAAHQQTAGLGPAAPGAGVQGQPTGLPGLGRGEVPGEP